MKNFAVIVAATASTFGIGRLGGLPWKLPTDMAFFKKITSSTKNPSKQNAVIMGRKTWESLPSKFRPLSDRVNVVISGNPKLREELSIPSEVIISPNLSEALNALLVPEIEFKIESIFVIGGASVYREALCSQRCDHIFLTSIETEVDGLDTFFPNISAVDFRMISKSAPIRENDIKFCFTEFERVPSLACFREQAFEKFSINSDEMQYLRLVDDIIKTGNVRGDRTGTGTISKFGVQMRFSLRNDVFPLLTTKKVFWRGVAEELLWFVKGSTNGNELSEKGIHIWDGNGSREFLDQRGLSHREVGDLGPVYGFQWRHFGAMYTDFRAGVT
jgi:dihydrofolate reductase/thymidylate synthase